jgi:DNA-binding response OmpR family regulator
MRPLIFLIGNNSLSYQLVKACLGNSSYRLREYASTEILHHIEALRPAAILIDNALPNNKALELCGAIRMNAPTQESRVILFGNGSCGLDCILGMKAGADCCLALPLMADELIAGIDAVIRRPRLPWPQVECGSDTDLRLGDVELNLLAMRVSVAGEAVPITVLEFRLLEYLARNQGRVFTRDQLLDAVWGEDRFVLPRTVDACVRRIRNKIEPGNGKSSVLRTIRGVGYCLENLLSN